MLETMAPCIAVTKKGTPCTLKAKQYGRCTRHHNMYVEATRPKDICVTITFGDVAENHVGMQKIGNMRDAGFTTAELMLAKSRYESFDYKCELIRLSSVCTHPKYAGTLFDDASVLIIRDFTRCWSNEILQRQFTLAWDTKAKMHGRVVNKHARYNICYSDVAQEADYENGKGTVVSFDSLPKLSQVRGCLPNYLGEKARELNAEGNLYYDISKCGIGWHGDAERKIVIALRLGKTMPLAYQWYLQSEPIGPRVGITLGHGDMYVMSEKATGFDWKKRSIATLRHSAGCHKYTGIGE